MLFAYVPPTLAAALITTSGPNSEINLEVSSRPTDLYLPCRKYVRKQINI